MPAACWQICSRATAATRPILPMSQARSAARASTMDFVREVLGLPADGYALDDRLREIGYGEWEGSTLAADAGQGPGAVRQTPDREMDDVVAGRARPMPRCSFGCATGTIR